MCLIINSTVHKKRFGKHIPIKTASDLIVYKYVKFDEKGKNITMVNSPIQNFTFIINDMYYTKFKLGDRNSGAVYNGFHSFINKPFECKAYFINLFNSNGIATCIIPKGSKIFISYDYKQIVSNKIKIIGVEKL